MPELTPEDRKRIYEEEKARMEARTTLENEKRKKTTPLARGCLILIIAIVAIGVLGHMIESCSSSPSNTRVTVSPEEQKRIAKHGPSPKDYEFESAIKAHLRNIAKDPDSVIIDRTSAIFYNDSDGWIVLAKWRAKNSFGAYDTDANWFVISEGKITMKDMNAYEAGK